MDEMEEYELYEIIDNLQYLDKNDWERTRLSIYSSVQMNTKKKLTPKDILTFPWENEHHEEKVITEISNDDIQRLKDKSKAIEKIINNGE